MKKLTASNPSGWRQERTYSDEKNSPVNQMEKEFLALVGQRWPAGTDTPVRKSNP